MTTGRINQVSCHETFSGEPRRVAMRSLYPYRLTASPKCIGTSNQIIILHSRFQSPLWSANESANSSVERIHSYLWYALSYTQAQGLLLLSEELSSQRIDYALGLLLLTAKTDSKQTVDPMPMTETVTSHGTTDH